MGQKSEGSEDISFWGQETQRQCWPDLPAFRVGHVPRTRRVLSTDRMRGGLRLQGLGLCGLVSTFGRKTVPGARRCRVWTGACIPARPCSADSVSPAAAGASGDRALELTRTGTSHPRHLRFSLRKDASGKSPWTVANSKSPNPAVSTEPRAVTAWWPRRG